MNKLSGNCHSIIPPEGHYQLVLFSLSDLFDSDDGFQDVIEVWTRIALVKELRLVPVWLEEHRSCDQYECYVSWGQMRRPEREAGSSILVETAIEDYHASGAVPAHHP